MMDLPLLLLRNANFETAILVCEKLNTSARESVSRAQDDARDHYSAATDEIANILVGCDRTWHRCGHASLFGAVFAISYELHCLLQALCRLSAMVGKRSNY